MIWSRNFYLLFYLFTYIFLFFLFVFSDLENASVAIVAKSYGPLKRVCNEARKFRDQEKDYDDSADCSILRESNEYMRSFVDNSLQFAPELMNHISSEDFVGDENFEQSIKEALRRSVDDVNVSFPEDSEDFFLANVVADLEKVNVKSRLFLILFIVIFLLSLISFYFRAATSTPIKENCQSFPVVDESTIGRQETVGSFSGICRHGGAFSCPSCWHTVKINPATEKASSSPAACWEYNAVPADAAPVISLDHCDPSIMVEGLVDELITESISDYIATIVVPGMINERLSLGLQPLQNEM